MTLITDVRLRRVLDSRGNATVEADVLTESAASARQSPSGASTGEYEAIELPASEAIANAREDAIPRLVGEVQCRGTSATSTRRSTPPTARTTSPASAPTAPSLSLMVAAKAGADVIGAPLFQHLGGTFRGNGSRPRWATSCGGEHAADATHIQEFLLAPIRAPSVSEAIFANAAVHQEVHDILTERGIAAGKGRRRRLAPSIDDAEAFEIVDEAVETVADDVGFAIQFGPDVAGAELYDEDEDGYVYGDEVRSTEEQIDYIAAPVEEYDLVYVEDPDENDYEAFADLTERVGDQTLVWWGRPVRHQRRTALPRSS